MVGEQTLRIDKYFKFFTESKELFLAAAMELIDCRNQLNLRLSEERLRSKEHSLSRCIERIEKMVSMYSNFMEFNMRRTSDDLVTVD